VLITNLDANILHHIKFIKSASLNECWHNWKAEAEYHAKAPQYVVLQVNKKCIPISITSLCQILNGMYIHIPCTHMKAEDNKKAHITIRLMLVF
jgi:hypothetical protein